MIHLFWEALAALDGTPCRLLECGSRRQPGQGDGEGTNGHLYRDDVQVFGLDAEAGAGVNVVADLHDLRGSGVLAGDFDAVLICSTLEHVRRPWVVARELAIVTRSGGVLYCQTHQSFPLHDYPADYFRFSALALAEVFSPDAGWVEMAKGHEFPCRVVPSGNHLPHARDWNFEAEAYLNSWMLCRRA